MFEIYGGAWLFTDNTNYVNGQVRSQKPLARRNSIRFAVSKGAVTTIGADFLGVSASFQQIF